jgi:hypothetical protein
MPFCCEDEFSESTPVARNKIIGTINELVEQFQIGSVDPRAAGSSIEKENPARAE